jgi:hypothetical protein
MRPRILALPCTCGHTQGGHGPTDPSPCAGDDCACAEFECADPAAEDAADTPCEGGEPCLDCEDGVTWCMDKRAELAARAYRGTASRHDEGWEHYVDREDRWRP